MKYKSLLLIVIISSALLVRLYNFTDRMTFGPEQARSLLVSSRMITDKPTLLGQEYFRINSFGHKLFSGALFNYTLIPLLLVFKFNPVPITVYFAFLNLFTGLLFYFFIREIGFRLALFSTTLFLFNDYMIYHSFFIWNYNYLPLVGLLLFYALYKYRKEKKLKYTLFSGLLVGVSINLQYLMILLGVLVFLYLLKNAKKIIHTVYFLFGVLVGNFTILLFDARHNFYHTRALIQYAKDTLSGSQHLGLSYYHFLEFWPLFILAAALFLNYIWRFNKKLSMAVLSFYIILNVASDKINFNRSTGMPDGLSYKDILASSYKISKDVQGPFNVATLLDFDTRGFVLRYPLEFLFSKTPMGVTDYPSSDTLYVLANKSYNFEKSDVWELSVLKPYSLQTLFEINQTYSVFKLERL